MNSIPGKTGTNAASSNRLPTNNWSNAAGIKITTRRNTLQTQELTNVDLLKTSWTYQAREFFNNSNLHGVRYIAEKDRPFHEKFIWFSFIVMGLLVTSVIIISLWEKFQMSPTITGLDTNFHEWDISFPAITVCPANPADSNLVSQYVIEHWGNETEEQFNYYKDFVVKIANLSYDNFEIINGYSEDGNLLGENLKELVTSVVMRCDDLLYDCVWKGEAYNCCEIFVPILTDNGFCYTFNSKHFEVDFPTMTSKQLEENSKIKYIYETDNVLSLIFNAVDVKKNPLAVYIHSFPEKIVADSAPHHAWTRRVNKIMFSPKETYTTEEARQLSISQRHCVFPDEIKLSVDDEYTFGGCMSQCRMNMAMDKCGCVPHFYRKTDGYKHCDLNGLVCLAGHRKEIQKAYNCECELSCMHTAYEIEKLEDAKKDIEDGPLEISFVSWPMIRYKRDVLFGWVDLLVAIGGIAGLFLGFSLLSAVETIYFFTLRAFCMVYREKEELTNLHDEYEKAEEPEINLDLKPFFRQDSDIKKRKKSVDEENVIYTIPYLP